MEETIKRPKLPEYSDITVRQILWLAELAESNSLTEAAARIKGASLAMISRDLSKLQDLLNLDKSKPLGNFLSSETAKRIRLAARPLMEVLETISEGRKDKFVSFGAGAGILGWLIGSKIDDIRKLCNKGKSPGEEVYIKCSRLPNFEIVKLVHAGILDFGIIRGGAIASIPKAGVSSTQIGEQTFVLVIPKNQRFASYHEALNSSDSQIRAEAQRKVLLNEYIATVTSDREFRNQLHDAFTRSAIYPKVEFSYDNFPEVLPHLIKGTHVAIAPISALWNNRLTMCEYYPLAMLEHFKRPVFLIHNEQLKPPWIDTDYLAGILSAGLLIGSTYGHPRENLEF